MADTVTVQLTYRDFELLAIALSEAEAYERKQDGDRIDFSPLRGKFADAIRAQKV